MNPKPRFNVYEKAVLRTLYQFKIYLSICEIAKHTGLGYAAVKKYTEILYKKGVLTKKQGKGVCYQFNFKIFDKEE